MRSIAVCTVLGGIVFILSHVYSSSLANLLYAWITLDFLFYLSLRLRAFNTSSEIIILQNENTVFVVATNLITITFLNKISFSNFHTYNTLAKGIGGALQSR